MATFEGKLTVLGLELAGVRHVRVEIYLPPTAARVHSNHQLVSLM